MAVAVGVDSHKSSLCAAAVDELGAVVWIKEFTNDPSGHRKLVKSLDPKVVIGIECSGNFGAGLVKALRGAGHDALEVPAGLAYREAVRRQAVGKSDPTDAIAIARVTQRGEGLASTRRELVMEDLRLLSDHRDQLVCQRTKLVNRIHKDLLVVRPGYEKAIARLGTRRGLGQALSLIRGNRSVRAELIRERVGDIGRIDARVKDLDASIKDKLALSGTSLTELAGVGHRIAARILGEVGGIARIRGASSFAMMAGAAPVKASSGTTSRHRLNRGGNRKLNYALHYMAIV